ncbi:MAG TPA: CHAT domain-containing protein [Pyrinomonadaceae bacterium]|nr:CHAT domain-containing protein [Pyrinomonadaceae bacterium]
MSNTLHPTREKFQNCVAHLLLASLLLLPAAVRAQQAAPQPTEFDKLAAALLAAKAGAERDALLESSGPLVKGELSQALMLAGDKERERSNHARALEAYGLAHEVAERLDDRSRVADSLARHGMVHRARGDYPLALDYYNRSHALAEKIGDRVVAARTLNAIGNVYIFQGDPDLALRHYEESLRILEELKREGEVSRALNNIGNVRQMKGDLRQALQVYRRSLALKERLGDKSGIAQTLTNIGLIHSKQGDQQLALDYHRRSYALAEELGNRDGMARALNNEGNAHRNAGDYAKALASHQRSLKLKEEIGARDGVAQSLHNIGSVLAAEGKHAEALEHYRRALAMRAALGHRANVAITLGDMALAHLARGEGAAALEASERAVALARRYNSADLLWQALTALGKSRAATARTREAREAFAEAVEIVEEMRGQVAGGELDRQGFFESKVAPYVELVSLLVGEGRGEEALAYAERAKARVLLEVVRGGRAALSESVTEAERKRERDLYERLVSLNGQLAVESQKASPDAARVAELSERLRAARLAYRGFQSELYAAHSELRVRRGELRPLALADAAALLPDARTALAEFVVADAATYLFVLTRERAGAPPRLRVNKIDVGRNELARRVGEFRGQLAARGLGFRRAARELHDLLLMPARQQLEGKTRVVFAPDAALWDLPFQALQTPDGKYLIESAEISYAQSLTVLREMRHSRKAEATGAATLVAFGNPALGGETSNTPQLPEAEWQVLALRDLYGAARTRVYTRAEAREGRLKAEAGAARVLHLATHGVLDDASPIYSHLLLASEDGRGGEDGLLEAWEIMSLDLNARLVVLSACETARGRAAAGEGVIGMTWALFVAGSPATVVSQWKVEEWGTTELMLDFHRRYRDRPATAAALREAALKSLRDPRRAHPFYWAGFVVVGDAM